MESQQEVPNAQEEMQEGQEEVQEGQEDVQEGQEEVQEGQEEVGGDDRKVGRGNKMVEERRKQRQRGGGSEEKRKGVSQLGDTLDSPVKQQVSGGWKRLEEDSGKKRKGKLEVSSEGQSVFLEEDDGSTGMSGDQEERSEEQGTSAAKSLKP
ncbi:hypothetical protein XELAEV_18011132mg [Xenopus laevis]|uniref:Uncharacterized protein n=1 Tax=Xenopus laevis TaxID=8355 RepID=A0A974I2E5_XENLA|nr:hypothetical protein XELAEV_18011132mg [Xenopus laevis]